VFLNCEPAPFLMPCSVPASRHIRLLLQYLGTANVTRGVEKRQREESSG
jgi:hypothetical protein